MTLTEFIEQVMKENNIESDAKKIEEMITDIAQGRSKGGDGCVAISDDEIRDMVINNAQLAQIKAKEEAERNAKDEAERKAREEQKAEEKAEKFAQREKAKAEAKAQKQLEREMLKAQKLKEKEEQKAKKEEERIKSFYEEGKQTALF